MIENRFPPGWNDENVRQVLAYYENQTDDEALIEDEAGLEPSETVMKVPHDLVPKENTVIAVNPVLRNSMRTA